jgi:glycosyltransferase involved in cell wall biosynthesis
MSNPLVSVLMTAYNRKKYIAEAIESVIASTYQNLELIIVDDCSVDNTVDIAKSYSEKDSRIRVYVNEKNLGDYPNRNRAASYATGEYLMYVDSDDKITFDALKYIVESFHEFPQSNHSAIYYINDITLPFLSGSEDTLRNHFFGKNILSGGPGSRVFKRDFFKLMDGYPEIYGPANDMYFNVKTTLESPILFLPLNYLYYREHADQESKNVEAYILQNYKYFNDLFLNFNMPFSKNEKKYFINKNKRRLLVNIFRYIRMNGRISILISILKQTKFSLIDLFKAILN